MCNIIHLFDIFVHFSKIFLHLLDRTISGESGKTLRILTILRLERVCNSHQHGSNSKEEGYISNCSINQETDVYLRLMMLKNSNQRTMAP